MHQGLLAITPQAFAEITKMFKKNCTTTTNKNKTKDSQFNQKNTTTAKITKLTDIEALIERFVSLEVS